MLAAVFKSKFTYWILLLYFLIVAWWIKIQLSGATGTDEAYIFNWSYGLIGLSTTIYGLSVAFSKWGGWSSVIGRGLIFLSFGLFGQWFGLQIWTYYNVLAKIEVPYPSLADIGYFALIPFYTLAALMFAIAAGAKFSLRTSGGKLYALFIPIIALAIAYWLFLKDIGFNGSDPIKTFLDFGYPLGEILPVAIALFTLTLSKSLLGGTMKSRILFLVGAFFFQFLTEYLFLYAAGVGTYVNGGWNDLLYATSYTIMALGIVSFRDYS